MIPPPQTNISRTRPRERKRTTVKHGPRFPTHRTVSEGYHGQWYEKLLKYQRAWMYHPHPFSGSDYFEV